MTATASFPVTLQERMALGERELRFPGTLDEFGALDAVCEFNLEYQNGEIIAMGYASDLHEQITFNLIGLLFNIIRGTDINRYGSNRHIYLPSFSAAYSPDISLVKGAPELFEYRPGMTANTNPYLIVEVLSDSTREKDWSEKLPRYKKIASLRQIIYLEQDTPYVTVFNRIGDSSRWENEDFDLLEQSFLVEGQPVLLREVYENVGFKVG